MEIRTVDYKYEEIKVDDCPIGYILLNDENKVEFASLFNDYISDKQEADMLLHFAKCINKYEWDED